MRLITSALRIPTAAFALSLITALARAQNFSLEWLPLEGAAWNASGGTLSVVGELHPTEEFVMRGGSFVVTASFLTAEKLALGTITRGPALQSLVLTAGQVRFEILGAAGLTLRVERALSPIGPWASVGTVVLDAQGGGQFLDTNPPERAAFYRTR